MASKLLNKTEVERSKRDYEIKKASYDSEVETLRAEAELAYKLQVSYKYETRLLFLVMSYFVNKKFVKS